MGQVQAWPVFNLYVRYVLDLEKGWPIGERKKKSVRMEKEL